MGKIRDNAYPLPHVREGGHDAYYQTSRPWQDDTEDLETRDWAFNRHSMNLPLALIGDDEGGIGNVSPFDNGVISVGTDNIEVRLVQGIPETFRDVIARATKATIGVEPGEFVDDRDADEMMKGGLQTALEDAVVVFEVRGVSRTCTHQLVRTRKAAFHQQSQRASFMGEFPEVRMPESVWRKPEAREAFLRAVEAAHEAYNVACEYDVAYQDARFILPEGTATYIMLEYPLRTFIDTYNYRGCYMFQWEIGRVFRECRRVLVEAYPWLEPHIKISCERTHGAKDEGEFGGEPHEAGAFAHTCTFQGWESVEGQCPFPWARDSNRQYQPREDLLIKREPKDDGMGGHDAWRREREEPDARWTGPTPLGGRLPTSERDVRDVPGVTTVENEEAGGVMCPACESNQMDAYDILNDGLAIKHYRVCDECGYREDI